MGLFNLFNADPQPEQQKPGLFEGMAPGGAGQSLGKAAGVFGQDKPAGEQVGQQMGQQAQAPLTARQQNSQALAQVPSYQRPGVAFHARAQQHQDRRNAAQTAAANPISVGAAGAIQQQRITDEGAPTNFDFVQAQRGIYG
jgi:hypothetical protein